MGTDLFKMASVSHILCHKKKKCPNLLKKLYLACEFKLFKTFSKPSVKLSEVKHDLYLALGKIKNIKLKLYAKIFSKLHLFHLLVAKSHGFSKSVINI